MKITRVNGPATKPTELESWMLLMGEKDKEIAKLKMTIGIYEVTIEQDKTIIEGLEAKIGTLKHDLKCMGDAWQDQSDRLKKIKDLL